VAATATLVACVLLGLFGTDKRREDQPSHNWQAPWWPPEEQPVVAVVYTLRAVGDNLLVNHAGLVEARPGPSRGGTACRVQGGVVVMLSTGSLTHLQAALDVGISNLRLSRT